MADMMSTLKAMLGDNADEKIQSAMNMLQSSGLLSQVGNNAQTQTPPPTPVQTTPAPQPEVSSNTTNSTQQNTALPMLTPEGLQFLNQIRGMVDQVTNSNDSRSNLLRSLRPFMRTDRQRSIDRAIRIMNIGRFSGLFGR